MSKTWQHPRHKLDDVIHVPVRLSIMAALAPAGRVDFRYLRELLDVSDSLLSKHLSVLEEAGYVEVIKGYVGKRPRTWLRVTDAGGIAFKNYKTTLKELLSSSVSGTDIETKE